MSIIQISSNIAGYERWFFIEEGLDFENINKKYIIDCLLNSNMSLSIRDRFVYIISHAPLTAIADRIEEWGEYISEEISFTKVEVLKP